MIAYLDFASRAEILREQPRGYGAVKCWEMQPNANIRRCYWSVKECFRSLVGGCSHAGDIGLVCPMKLVVDEDDFVHAGCSHALLFTSLNFVS